MSTPIRLLDLGEVSPLRSQAIYHGLAETLTAESPDTIVLLRPAAPYLCVGFHQRPAEELDLAYCREAGFPVLHRRVGGGTVYLDRNQLFYQCLFHRSRAPRRVVDIYARYLQGPVAALRALGLAARLEPANELEVNGRRIAGIGGGQLDEAVVVVGNILFDFRYDLMTRAWRVPSEAFRRLAAAALRRHVTTLEAELGGRPSPEELRRLLIAGYESTLGRPLIPGQLTAGEEAAVARAEARLACARRSPAPPDRPRPPLKIAREVYVREVRWRTATGEARLALWTCRGVIEALAAEGSVNGCSRWLDTLRGLRATAEALRAWARGRGTDAGELVGALLEVCGGGGNGAGAAARPAQEPPGPGRVAPETERGH